MRALTFQGVENVQYQPVADPHLAAPDEAIVKVERAAICGSDLHVFFGRETGLDVGTIMGHEFVGEIVELGRNVRSLKKGMRVASPFTTCCGRCFYCERGLSARCARGQLFGWVVGSQGLQGVQAEYVRVPLAKSTLFPLPDEIPSIRGLLLGDVLPTGFFCAERAEIHPRGTFVVLGCGPVGLMTVLCALELGAERLYAVDALPERLKLAERFGATPVNLRDREVITLIKDVTEGRGADAVMEAVGSEEAGRLAYDIVRPGGIISVVGVHTESQFGFSPVEAYDKNLTYKAGRCPARSYMDRLLPLLRAKYDFESIISHELPLARGVEAYRLFAHKLEGCTKVVLQP